jgi:hypothetical protein
VFQWEEKQEADGTVTACLEGTRVLITRAPPGAVGPWRWDVKFADGQVQTGYAEDGETALKTGKRVAERFLT